MTWYLLIDLQIVAIVIRARTAYTDEMNHKPEIGALQLAYKQWY
jgi:hypothetical protein